MQFIFVKMVNSFFCDSSDINMNKDFAYRENMKVTLDDRFSLGKVDSDMTCKEQGALGVFGLYWRFGGAK